MRNIILVYGVIAGAIVIGGMIFSLSFGVDESNVAGLEYLGYLIMIVALSLIALGIRRYRDDDLGGVITFGTATLVGVGIAAVAGVIYVAVWEVYLAMTDHAFINDYVAGAIEAKKAEGVTGTELAEFTEEMQTLQANYGKPLFRLPMTFLEIFPVGLVIALLSAAFLKKTGAD